MESKLRGELSGERLKAASDSAGRQVYDCALGFHGNCSDTATVSCSRHIVLPREGLRIAWHVRGII